MNKGFKLSWHSFCLCAALLGGDRVYTAPVGGAQCGEHSGHDLPDRCLPVQAVVKPGARRVKRMFVS